MESIKSWLLSVCAAGAVCALAVELTGKDGAGSAMVRTLAGLVLLLALLQPLSVRSSIDPEAMYDSFRAEADEAVAAGNAHANNLLAESITQRLTAYILDKAASLGADVAVEITLSGDALPQLRQVCITGDVSPYARTQLAAVLEKELGLTGGDLQWK